MVVEAGRALVLAFNKWDLVDEDRRPTLAKEIERELARVPWAPRVNVSALTGRAVDKLAPALRTALDGLGDPDPDRQAQRLAQRPDRRDAAAGPRRQAAEGAVRDPGRHPAAAVRAVHQRLPRGRLPAVHRAPAARGLRLRRHARSRSASGSARSAARATAEPSWPRFAGPRRWYFGAAAGSSDPVAGMWRSLVAHLTGGQGVAGSNPVIPTDVMSRDTVHRCLATSLLACFW